jgi:acyl-CoA thioesterase FadM
MMAHRRSGLGQLRSLDVEALLFPPSAFRSEGSGVLLFVVPASLIPEGDSHLGYTQLVRILEVSRVVEWQRHLPSLAGRGVVDCAVTGIEVRFRLPVEAGEAVRVCSEFSKRDRRSVEFSSKVSRESGAVCLTSRMTLCLLDERGRVVAAPDFGWGAA